MDPAWSEEKESWETCVKPAPLPASTFKSSGLYFLGPILIMGAYGAPLGPFQACLISKTVWKEGPSSPSPNLATKGQAEQLAPGAGQRLGSSSPVTKESKPG